MVLDKTGSEKSSTNNPLEQFVLLAKGAKGAAAVELIKQALESPGVYVFAELLDMPNIKELKEGKFEPHYNLLQIFASGTYKTYLENAGKLPTLTSLQKKKLQHLTIISLAAKTNCIPYTLLLDEVEIKNVRDLEDLIIEAIYADVIRGKLDQKNSCLEVDFAIGRDFREEDLSAIVSTLQEWCDSCESVLSEVDAQIVRANAEKSRHNQHKANIENQLVELKKTFKSQSDDADEMMPHADRIPGTAHEKIKKLSKPPKMARSSGKFWPRMDATK